MLNILQDESIVLEQAVNGQIDNLRVTCIDDGSKTATRIVQSLLYKFTNLAKKKDSESNMIIETLRPFLYHLIISPFVDIKLEW